MIRFICAPGCRDKRSYRHVPESRGRTIQPPKKTLRQLRTLGPIALLLAVVGFTSVMDGARLRYFNVEEQNNDFLITWESDLEESVRQFELQRSTASTNNEFVKVADVDAHGVGIRYEVRDNRVFKSSDLVNYRLQVVYESGARQVLVSQSVNYTPTAIRRTWGSIKAMF